MLCVASLALRFEDLGEHHNAVVDDDCERQTCRCAVHRAAAASRRRRHLAAWDWRRTCCLVNCTPQNGTEPLLAHQNLSIGLRGRGRKKGAEALATWDWEAQRAKVARVLCSVSEVDLAPLFAPAPVEDAFLQLWMKFVSLHPDCALLGLVKFALQVMTRQQGCGPASFGGTNHVAGEARFLVMQYLQLTLVIMCLQAQQLLDQPDPAALRNKQLVEGIARTLGAYPIRVQPAFDLCFSISL